MMIGDDMEQAVGPTGFHLPSIRRAIRACDAFAVVSAEPLFFFVIASLVFPITLLMWVFRVRRGGAGSATCR